MKCSLRKRVFPQSWLNPQLHQLRQFLPLQQFPQLQVKQPTDIFTVEEGKLYLEESDIRIYNKR